MADARVLRIDQPSTGAEARPIEDEEEVSGASSSSSGDFGSFAQAHASLLRTLDSLGVAGSTATASRYVHRLNIAASQQTTIDCGLLRARTRVYKHQSNEESSRTRQEKEITKKKETREARGERIWAQNSGHRRNNNKIRNKRRKIKTESLFRSKLHTRDVENRRSNKRSRTECCVAVCIVCSCGQSNGTK